MNENMNTTNINENMNDNVNVNDTNTTSTESKNNRFSSWIDSIMNSEALKKIKEFINSFIANFGLADTKEKVDSYINNTQDQENGTIFHGVYRRVSKFVEKKFGNKIKSRKLLYWISKIVCMLMAVGFGALVVYMMVKLLPKIIMMVAMVFATAISIEIIIAVLNRALSSTKIVNA